MFHVLTKKKSPTPQVVIRGETNKKQKCQYGGEIDCFLGREIIHTAKRIYRRNKKKNTETQLLVS